MIQWLRCCASTAGGTGSSPDGGTQSCMLGRIAKKKKSWGDGRDKRNVEGKGIREDPHGAQARGSMGRILNVKGRNEGQEMNTSRAHIIFHELY